MSSLWQYIVATATGKSVEDVAVAPDAMNDRVTAYTNKFDKNLTTKWDAETDAKKVAERQAAAQDMTNAYYDIATDFYEYGWGQSFHFATRFDGESFDQSIARHEHFLALKMNLKENMTVIDVGCGIGGPLREIARFTGAKVIGVNNNAYQVKRALRLNAAAGLSEVTDVVKGDFMALPFALNSIDAAYAIEATCHAPDRTGCYKQIYNVLVDGGIFAGYEWTMTDKFDPNNPTHNQIKHGIEEGNSLPTLTHYSDILTHLRAAGFEVIEHYDLALVERFGSIPWYSTFLGGLTLSQFKHTNFGRSCTNLMCSILETIGLAPKGTAVTAKLLGDTGTALAESGRTGIFTPMYMFVARKPNAQTKNAPAEKKSKSKQ